MLLCNVTEIDFLEYIIILLPYLGLHSNHVAKRFKSCVYKFYSCINLKGYISEHR